MLGRTDIGLLKEKEKYEPFLSREVSRVRHSEKRTGYIWVKKGVFGATKKVLGLAYLTRRTVILPHINLPGIFGQF